MSNATARDAMQCLCVCVCVCVCVREREREHKIIVLPPPKVATLSGRQTSQTPRYATVSIYISYVFFYCQSHFRQLTFARERYGLEDKSRLRYVMNCNRASYSRDFQRVKMQYISLI